jgi:hypothetical protein
MRVFLCNHVSECKPANSTTTGKISLTGISGPLASLLLASNVRMLSVDQQAV